MQTLDLTSFEFAQGPVGGPIPPPEGWAPAVVPGGVHESLLAAGQIGHPFHDRNEQDVRWVEDRDWWFRTELPGLDTAPDERVRLVFEGLDTVVDVWLDDELLGHHENMFRPAEFDVTGRSGRLVLRFSPPLAGLSVPQAAQDQIGKLIEKYAPPGVELTVADVMTDGGGLPSPVLPLATQRRKAAFSWGWDFGPRVPSIGIWRPVRIRHERRARLLGHHIRTLSVQETTAQLGLEVEVEAFAADSPLTAVVTLTAPSGSVQRFVLPVQDGKAFSTCEITDAELWWTHDLGNPALYEVRVSLLEGSDVLDEVEDRIGIRALTLDRSPDDEGGNYFRFLLNGVPVFARGANWLPASQLIGSVDASRRQQLVQLAREGGMNMLRVWGGGIYEDEAFYQACDQAGVLVWQDFAFACIDYPSGDAALQHEVTLEAEYQVRRLRNHPSLALWCGNNEVHPVHGYTFGNQDPGDWGWHFFHQILPATVERLDGTTPYWPGSPWGEDLGEGVRAPNGKLDGDRHAWEVWHGSEFGMGAPDLPDVGQARLYRRYAEDNGKFISEFGIHAAPEYATLARWIPQEQLTLHSPAFDAHNKDHPKDKHNPVLDIVTGRPQNIHEYIHASMASQAEGLKFGIEHYRRRQPHCSGTLIWQHNDVWPGFSWSVIDHDLVPKAGYYFAQRAFSPLLASFRHHDERLELWLSNSGRAVSTTALVTLEHFGGTIATLQKVSADLAAGESRMVWSTAMPADPTLIARVTGDGFPTNRLFFAEIKDLPLNGTLDWSVKERSATEADVHVRARGYAYFVHVPSVVPGIRFSTNYLELRDAEEAVIRVSGLPLGFDPSSLEPRTYAGPSIAPPRPQ
ncbi:glycoside hydrolase family 2 protein [Kineosporia babensis]|uniref:beta-mannosidase n=1 Tax=Kineosporia babensis TaxID=499548 RepID=A0A9X1SWJ3_9ACTN|nr:hypothetical protein [Kineosporia babensis]MCD5314831.1 hypothetical protein [Kineosporia babensis]